MNALSVKSWVTMWRDFFRECVTEMQENLAFQQEATDEQERSADGYLQMCHDACDKEVLEYLQLVSAGIDTFLQTHPAPKSRL